MKAVASSQLAVVKNHSDTEILEVFDWLIIFTPNALVVCVKSFDGLKNTLISPNSSSVFSVSLWSIS